MRITTESITAAITITGEEVIGVANLENQNCSMGMIIVRVGGLGRL